MSEEQLKMSEDLKIFVQPTPNPLAFKFVTNKILKSGTYITFNKEDYRTQADIPKLVGNVLDIEGVSSVHIFANALTASFEKEVSDHEDMIEKVKSVLMTRIVIHNPDFQVEKEASTKKKVKDRSELSPELQKIEEILDRTIRSGLNADGGGLEVVSFEDKELKIRYEGACASCPQSLYGTLQAIQDILSYELKMEDLKVTPVIEY